MALTLTTLSSPLSPTKKANRGQRVNAFPQFDRMAG